MTLAAAAGSAARDANVLDRFPLSPFQQGMLIQTLRAPGSGVNLVQTVIEFTERLDAGALRGAWAHVAARHPMLRTRFAWEGLDQPVQEVLSPPAAAAEWLEEDWRASGVGELEGRWRELLDRDRRAGITLDAAPCYRLRLVRLGSDAYRLLFTWHHLLLDGRSMAIVQEEVLSAYATARAGTPALAGTAPSYRPYVEWMASRDWGSAERYWRSLVAGFSAPTPLPGRRATPTNEDVPLRAADETVIAPAVAAGLRAVAAAAGVTLNIVVQAAWAVVLGRCADERDVVFGVTRRCRHGGLAGANDIVGPMINTLPVRTDVSPERSVVDLLRSLRVQWDAAREHEQAPTARIQGWSMVPPGTPLLESIVVFESTILDDTLPGEGVERRRRVRHLAQTHFPITFVADAGSEFRLKIEYDRSLFAAADIARLLERAAIVLSGIATNPAATLGSLPLLPPSERELVVHRWNATARDYAPLATGQCLHELIEAQCARTPGAIAVAADDGTLPLTYAGLVARTTALAAWLRVSGVGPGVLVGVCLERSTDLVVALVAVLRAGGAYVPLDAGYPADRIGFMLDDSGVSVLLSHSALRPRLDAALGAVARASNAVDAPPLRTLCLDTDWPDVEAAALRPAAPLARRVRPSDPAYMIYTSGSTGRPKGALNAHEGIVNRLCWMQEAYELSDRDTVVQKTPVSFDVSVWEFFWPLMTGARLVLARPGGHQDPAYLADLIVRERVSVAHFVPAMLRAFLASPDVREHAMALGATLRHVICSGEALSFDLQETAFRTLGAGLALHNLYGPTECAVDVTEWRCRPRDPEGTVPIGRPIANTEVYVLDAAGNPVPVGTPGELHLGGIQVGLGYHRRPELTAERFVADPFGARPGGRLYRTGDRARWRSDGVVEYLGRLDDQVKLRGLRIELGEIEAMLRTARGVRDATVVVRSDRTGEPRLVAYVVADSRTDTDGLRVHLAATLPDYMVPASYVFLDVLPLSANGKVDRKRLPAPDESVSSARPGHVAPRSATERVLADIWAAVLKLDVVGVDDNFFALGGDSILSLQVIARARAAGLRITPAMVFDHPTVGRLAAAAPAATPAAAEVAEGGDLPLTPVQRWFFEQRLAGAHHWNQSFVFSVPAAFDDAALRRASTLLAARHDALRLRFTRAEQGWVQTLAPADDAVRVERRDLSGVPAAEQVAAVERDSALLQASLDLAAGPLVRLMHFHLGHGRPGRLVIVAHHLCIDGVSWGVLMHDLEQAYRGCIAGAPVTLAATSTSFGAWARGLRAYASTPALAADIDRWAAVHAAHASPLPAGRAGGAATEGAAQTLTATLDASETDALLREVPGAYGTQMNDALLAALGTALCAWAGGAVLVDVEGHGREDVVPGADVARTIGWFTSIFPVRLDIAPAADPRTALAAAAAELRAIPNRGVGYGVARYLAGDTRLAGGAQPQVLFNYLGQFDRVVDGSTLFGFAPEAGGPWRAAVAARRYLLDVNALVTGGRLEMRWTYDPARYTEAAIAALADACAMMLRRIVRARETATRIYVPADFPLAALDPGELARLTDGHDDIEDVYPATAMQELFYGVADPARDPGFEQWRYELRGPLDVAALRRAWSDAVARHSMLRTGFVSAGVRRPMQVVRKAVSVPWCELDWRDASPAEQAARMEEMLHHDRSLGFDFAAPPLMRVTLVRTGESDWQLVWSHHHLLIDRLSWPIVLADVRAAYLGAEAAPLPAPYREYVQWLARRNPEEAEDFWRGELAGARQQSAISGVQESGPATESQVRLSAADTAALTSAARAAGLTPNTFVQGAWALWLAARAGTDDVVFGVAVAGRPADVAGIERMVGLFINNLPARARVSPTATVRDWLHSLQRRIRAAQEFDWLPAARLHELSGLPWRQRLFEGLIVFQNDEVPAEATAWLGEEVEVRQMPVATRTAYPLTLLVEGGDALPLRLVAQAGALDAAEGGRAIAAIADLIRRLSADPDAALGTVVGPQGGVRPAPTAPARAHLPAPARTPLERAVGRIWAELLDMEMVGIDDNLFELGAHSVLATQLATRVRETFRVALPLRAVFDSPTVAGMSRALLAHETVPGQTDKIARLLDRIEAMSAEQIGAAMRDPAVPRKATPNGH